jgi:hypothetical protein
MATKDSKFNDRVEAAADIKKLPFKVATNILLGIAILSVIGRVGLKIHHRRSFLADDYILFFGTACLIAGTAVLFYQLDTLYLGPAIQADPELVFYLDAHDLNELIYNEIKYLDTFFSLLWTATFSVKFSFLAFFWKLVNAAENLRIFYRVTIVCTFIAWGFIICQPFIICPYFGWRSVKCYQQPNTRLYNALIITGTVLDIITDLMIVIIPILVLRRSPLKSRQKVAVGTFLSLSTVMIIVSITRSTKIHGPPNVPINVTWAIFWTHIEASVAIIMVSLTAFRTIFNQKKQERAQQERMRRVNSWRLFASFRRKPRTDSDDEITALPQVPRATMTGLRTFIRGSNRSEASSTVAASQGMSFKSTLRSNVTSNDDSMSITALPQVHETDTEPWMTRPDWV